MSVHEEQPFGTSRLDLPFEEIEHRNSRQWIEESALLGTDTSTGEYTKHSVHPRTLQRTGLAIAFVMCVILGRLLFLQVWHGADYALAAERNSNRLVPIPAERGHIYDSNGIQLTSNIPNFSLAIVPQDMPRVWIEDPSDKGYQERQAIVEKLSAITGRDEAFLLDIIKKYSHYTHQSVAILEDIDYETALRLHAATGEIPGIRIEQGSKRLYEHVLSDGTTARFESSTPHSLSHVLGYQGKLNTEEYEALKTSGYLLTDIIGKTGIEYAYESTLRGVYGRRQIEVDTRGRLQQIVTEEAPIPGTHVQLSIDAQFQQAIEDILHETLPQLEEASTDRASVVALDPRTGKVKALVSLPAFDNNDFSGGISQDAYRVYHENESQPLFNRAIGGRYPSGSVVKPAMATIALQEGIISAATVFPSTGGIRVGQWFFPDWRPAGHGPTDVRWSIADSVNTFYYYIGGGYADFVGLGVDRIVAGLELFGFGTALGIDLPGEADGFLPSKAWKQEAKGEPWYIGDTYNLSIGQGDLLVSPLQIAVMTAAVANNGTVYQPQVVEQFIDPKTQETDPIDPVVIRDHIMEPRYLATVRQGMYDCTLTGSCRHLSQLPMPIAGKTGTAQWNRTKNTHAWFTSFAPVDNPEIVVTLMIEEGGQGGVNAAPIVRDIYDWWIRNKSSLAL